MVLSKSSYNFKAGSLLESLIALTIIAICLYIATMVYAAVFTSKTSLKYYREQNSINEVFFLLQLKQDSIPLPEDNKNKFEIVTEKNDGFDKVIIMHKDSSQTEWNERIFYINE
ncbi:type II secretion system protein [Flavobacterium sp. RHBU_24]|uniref:type II secretion system protein n=1 Tax=Flavobacterium sp. RHBU_24 TaxID=3391185 RepID=UPI003985271E